MPRLLAPIAIRQVLLHPAMVLACLTGTTPALAAPAKEKPAVVRVVKAGGGWQLLRNAKPYFIKGAGGDGSRALLARAGGNSIRTWGADRLDQLLDEAHRYGLSVTVGIWLGHERHGFNYNDAGQVAAQYQAARKAILRYKDHPAVLMWALGNEMEGYARGDNAAIWSAINNLATLAKKLDPNHPTMTVVAEIGGDRVENIHRLCPDVDIVGINCYGGLPSLPQRYRKAGGVKPYVVTEFGLPGVWETKRNRWGAVPELTSTQKARLYGDGYRRGIAGARGLCLGSYAFAWGNKQEATATWFGMLLPDGARLGAVDALTEVWTGKPPAHPCPVIDGVRLQGGDEVDPGATVKATLTASSPKGDALKVRWVLQQDVDDYNVGGDNEAAPPTFPRAIVRSDLKSVEVRLPKEGGVYRLYAFVYDAHGGAAVANVPVRVKGPPVVRKGRPARLPLVVYDEADRAKAPYAPAGWMGNTRGLKLDEAWKEKPPAGKTRIRIVYGPKEGWAGVVWQSPANDWGARAGGWDVSGAKRLRFWARGENGGEVVNFFFGVIGRDKRYFDTANGKMDGAALTKEWKEYTIDLRDKDLTRIKSGFGFSIGGRGGPVTFYLDDIRFE
jgi:hypothetical protein